MKAKILKDGQKVASRTGLNYGMFDNSDMVLFDKKASAATAFPRAHLVGAEVVNSGTIEFNFHTHLVTVTAPDADAIYDEVLGGSVSVLTELVSSNKENHIRSVTKIDVRSTGAQEQTNEADDQTAEAKA
jgi:hypothetical protein